MKNLRIFRVFSWLMLALCAMLTACNDNEAPETETNLSIIQQYMPVEMVFQKSDRDFLSQAMSFSGKQYVVNSVNELPNDPLGFNNAIKGVDFKKYTLLINYNLHDWTLDAYRSRYYRNNLEGTYNWAINVGTSTEPDPESEHLRFSRFAILVDKLPKDATVTSWFSVGALNWGWQ